MRVIQHGGSRAFYSPDRDLVQMPELQTFRDRESYYATLAHEMAHNVERRVMPRRSVFPFEMRSDRRGDAASEQFQEGDQSIAVISQPFEQRRRIALDESIM